MTCLVQQPNIQKYANYAPIDLDEVGLACINIKMHIIWILIIYGHKETAEKGSNECMNAES